jgi:hypothetical protein
VEKKAKKPETSKQKEGWDDSGIHWLAKQAQQVGCFAYTFAPKKEVVHLSETSLNFHQITQRYINVTKSAKYGVFITSTAGLYWKLKKLCLFYFRTKLRKDIRAEAARNLNILYVTYSKGLRVLFL